MTGTAGAGDERFAPAGGRVTAALGLVFVVAFVVLGILYPGSLPLPVIAAAVVVGVLIVLSALRPRVWATETSLVLRNSFSTVTVPLAAIEELAVRQVLAVRAGGRRHVCSGVGRSLRESLGRGRQGSALSGLFSARMSAGDMVPETKAEVEYADFVEDRIRELAGADRARRGIALRSDEQDALGAEVRRDLSWPAIGALAVALAFFVVTLFV